MTRRFRALLICLLMAVLPLQGLADVVQASCGPSHHARTVAAADQDGQHEHAADHHLAEAQHHHADAVADRDAAHADATCSACAACCTGGVAPPSSPLSGAPERPSSGADPTHASLLTGFVPAGLERPPRTASV